MKQSVERAALDAALCRLGLDFDETVKEKLLKHLSLVIEKNKVLNLTRITSLEEAVVLHIEDSLSVYKTFSQFKGEFLDIGTGAGFPGIPLAVTTGRKGSLLDSVKKKITAVQEFVDQLGLTEQVTTYGMRSEELVVSKRNHYGIVLARAVSSLPAVEELATPLLKHDGVLIAMRGVDSKADLNLGVQAAKKLGLKLIDRKEFSIGEDSEYTRSLCVFQKVGKSEIKLPRHPGFASKKPIVG